MKILKKFILFIYRIFRYIILGIISPFLFLKMLFEEKIEKVEVWKYIALTSNNKKEVGYIKTNDSDRIENFLITENKKLIKLKTNKWIRFLYRNVNDKEITRKELIFFLVQLTAYLNATNNLIESLSVMIKKVSNKRYAQILRNIRYQIMCGDSLAIALEKQGKSFPPLLISVLKNNLRDEYTLLEDMKNYYLNLYYSDKKGKKSFYYKIFVLPYILIVISFIFGYIIPQFYQLYKTLLNNDSNILNFLFSLSNMLKPYLNLSLILFFVIILLLLISCNKKIKKYFQNIIIKLPIIKNIIIDYQMILFSKSLSLLIKYNITDINDIGILTSNDNYQKLIIKTIYNLKKEHVISPVLKNNLYIPDKAYQMILTGEKFDSVLLQINNISNFYQNKVDKNEEKTMNILGPLLAIFSVILLSSIFLIIVFQCLIYVK